MQDVGGNPVALRAGTRPAPTLSAETENYCEIRWNIRYFEPAGRIQKQTIQAGFTTIGGYTI